MEAQTVAAPDNFDTKLLLYRALKEKALRIARSGADKMLEYVFGYTNAWFHQHWHEFIRDNQYGLILAMRAGGKSECVTVGTSLWEVGQNPNVRIKIVTETDDLAEKLLSRIAATILKNERYKEVFPNVVPAAVGSWNKHQITVERDVDHKDPTIEACSIMSASQGGRADLICFDDVAGPRNSLYQPSMREQVKEAFYSNWLNMLDGPKARWYMTATPWHLNDLVTELRHNKNIPKAKEVWVGDNFESPWPERYPNEYFKERLAVLKLKHYNRAYRGVALSDEEKWINPQAIKSCIDRDLKPYDIQVIGENTKFTGIDLGHRSGESNSPSVIFTGVRTPVGKRVPIDIKISHSSSALDLCKAIIHTYQTFSPALIMVENNGAQKYLTDIIEPLGPRGIPIEGHFTSTQKLDINTGVPSLLAEIETGQWIIPLGAGGDHEEDVCDCPFCIWMREVRDYPLAKMDTVMASWLFLLGLRKVCERANPGGNFSIWEF